MESTTIFQNDSLACLHAETGHVHQQQARFRVENPRVHGQLYLEAANQSLLGSGVFNHVLHQIDVCKPLLGNAFQPHLLPRCL